MTKTSSRDDAWALRVRQLEQDVNGGDTEQLHAAQVALRERAEEHGLSPAEAELLGQINMALGQ
jgi:hypothetical protein